MAIPPFDDWYDLYHKEVEAALADAFTSAAVVVAPSLSPESVQVLAAAFAKGHAGDLLKLDGDISVAKATRIRVQELVSKTLLEGESLKTLQKNLRADVAFSKERAILVARTETAIAHGRGGHEAAINSGRDEKHWVTQGSNECAKCIANAADGWIERDGVFSSGVATIPAHPNCMCNVRYRHGRG